MAVPLVLRKRLIAIWKPSTAVHAAQASRLECESCSGACSATSALAFQMSVTASSFVCPGFILKQRWCCSIALHPLSSARRCVLRAAPKDMFPSYHINGRVPLAWPFQRYSSHMKTCQDLGIFESWEFCSWLMKCAAGYVCGLSHRGIDAKTSYIAPTESVVILWVEI